MTPKQKRALIWEVVFELEELSQDVDRWCQSVLEVEGLGETFDAINKIHDVASEARMKALMIARELDSRA